MIRLIEKTVLAEDVEMVDNEFNIHIKLRRVYDGENTHNPTETTEKAFQHFLDVWHKIQEVVGQYEWYFEDWGWEWDIGPTDLVSKMLKERNKNG